MSDVNAEAMFTEHCRRWAAGPAGMITATQAETTGEQHVAADQMARAYSAGQIFQALFWALILGGLRRLEADGEPATIAELYPDLLAMWPGFLDQLTAVMTPRACAQVRAHVRAPERLLLQYN